MVTRQRNKQLQALQIRKAIGALLPGSCGAISKLVTPQAYGRAPGKTEFTSCLGRNWGGEGERDLLPL
jgi:hypothetical protein